MPAPDIKFAGDYLCKNKAELLSCTKCIFNSQLVMNFVGGPDNGEQFKFDDNEQFFYQPDGKAILRIRQNGQIREIELTQGSIIYLPERVEFAFKRESDTVGSVIKKPDSATGPLNNTSIVGEPIHVDTFIDQHSNEINAKSPFSLYLSSTSKSFVKIYGKGTHTLKNCPVSDLIFFSHRGEVIYHCNETNNKQHLEKFYLVHLKPTTEFTLEIPDGSYCVAIKISE